MNQYTDDVIPKYGNWLDLILEKEKEVPDKNAFTYLTDGEIINEKYLSYKEISECSKIIGGYLQEYNLQEERALLLYPQGLDYVKGFLGCLFGNVIAVPAYPPEKNKNLKRLLSIINDAKATVILTTSELLDEIKEMLSGQDEKIGNLKWIATDTLDLIYSEKWKYPEINDKTIAFLQYTSGSTSSPKGVMVTHHNLLHNQEYLVHTFGSDKNSVLISWLPLFHDMGLISKVLHTIYCEARCILMDPMDFVEKPLRWLKAISHYGGTISGVPNFAYELCAEKITEEEKLSLDLSTWRCAFNGAEPIRYGTYLRFFNAFKNCGFRIEACNPIYGLAEATLIFSAGTNDEIPKKIILDKEALNENRILEYENENSNSKTVPSCGKVLLDSIVKVINPQTLTEVKSNEVGEIWVMNPSVARGYWNRPDSTKEIFKAYVTNGDGPYLRTGDLGFIKEEEVYITGRKKDLIIVNGKNYYPQDFEYLSEVSDPALRPGNVAAFSIDYERTTKVVLLQEVRHNYSNQMTKNIEEIAYKIRSSINNQYDLNIDEIIFIKSGTIPKTSSGKIQRHGARLGYLNGELEIIGSDTLELKYSNSDTILPVDKNFLLNIKKVERINIIENKIIEISKNLFGLKQKISLETVLNKIGINSLKAVDFSNLVYEIFDTKVSMTFFLRDNNLKKIVEQIDQKILEENEPILESLNKDKKVELSYGQQALWYIQKLNPTNTAYNLSFPMLIKSKLDIPALERSLQQVINRHSVLRTSYVEENGSVFQSISQVKKLVLEYEVVDESLINSKIRALIEDYVYYPFNLSTESGIRFKLYKLKDEKYILLIVAHHIIMDFWSVEILLKELFDFYKLETTGEMPNLKEIDVKYTDYTLWQNKLLQSDKGDILRNYWKEKLDNDLPTLDLNTDYKRPKIQTFNGNTYSFNLDTSVTKMLNEISKKSNSTLYVTLLSAYHAFLHLLTGQNEILIGSPVNNRVRPELKQLVGYLTNPVVMKSTFNTDLKFLDLLGSVKSDVLNSLEHQELPFPNIMSEINYKRDSSRSPIFQTMFVFQKSNINDDFTPVLFGLTEEVNFGDIRIQPFSIQEKTSQFELELEVIEYKEELFFKWKYNTDLFSENTIVRFANYFTNFLNQISLNPSKLISEIRLMDENEFKKVLYQFNDTETPFSSNKCLHNLIEEKVECIPNNLAIVDDNNSLTYSDLNKAANRFAHYLIYRGVKNNDIVAISMERSVEMIINILGILKAGAAYLPIEVDVPQNRRKELLTDSNAKLCILDSIENLNFGIEEEQYIFYESIKNLVKNYPSINPRIAKKTDDLVSVFFTSGSTGKPKGVLNSHKGWVNRIEWMQRTYQLNEAETVLHKTAISFDDSAVEIFWPLISGGIIAVLAPEHHKDPWAILGAIKKHRVAVTQFVPSMLSNFIEASDTNDHDLKDYLRIIISSGEALSPNLVNAFYKKFSCNLYNQWGLTEVSIDSTQYQCSPADADLKNVPIGKPIANNKLYILDRYKNPVPPGVVGEIFLAGVGIAKGYINNVEKEKEVFINNPFETEGIMYKTGDWGFYHPNGDVIFLGRKDNQIKLNGIRLELGEIESALLGQPYVKYAVVQMIEKNKMSLLVGYVVMKSGNKFDNEGLRNYLMSKLPRYMVPAVIVELDKLPITTSGKLDRKALPMPNYISREKYSDTENALEEVIKHIWEEVLSVEVAGVNIEFFNLGGHSLLAIKVISQLRNLLRVEIPVSYIMENPTIKGLSNTILSTEKISGQVLETAKIVIQVIKMSLNETKLALQKTL